MAQHFKHCYVYEGSYCSCGANESGGYQGDRPGLDLLMPPAPFTVTAPTRPAAEEQ